MDKIDAYVFGAGTALAVGAATLLSLPAGGYIHRLEPVGNLQVRENEQIEVLKGKAFGNDGLFIRTVNEDSTSPYITFRNYLEQIPDKHERAIIEARIDSLEFSNRK